MDAEARHLFLKALIYDGLTKAHRKRISKSELDDMAVRAAELLGLKTKEDR